MITVASWGKRSLVSMLSRSRALVARLRGHAPGARPTPVASPLAELRAHFDADLPRATVLLFGDSVSIRVSRNDLDTRPLHLMLESSLAPSLRVASICGSAYHMGVYLEVVRALRRTRHRPDVLVLPINMRSFSPQWDLNPAWQLEDAQRALRLYAAGTDQEALPTIPRVPSAKDTAGFASTAVSYPLSSRSKIAEFLSIIGERPADPEAQQARLREIFVFHYTHPLVPTHPKLGQLAQLLRECEALGIRVVGYVTPLNYEAGRRHVGSAFDAAIDANISLLRACCVQATAGHRAQLLDCSRLLPASGFFHDDEPTEHLNQHGRAALSSAVAEGIRKTEPTKAGLSNDAH